MSEVLNKHIIEETVCKVGYLPELDKWSLVSSKPRDRRKAFWREPFTHPVENIYEGAPHL